MRTKALVELIDIFPSLTELAGIPVPPMCPENNNNMLACVEGTSVAPLLQDPDKEWKKAAFSQFARPYLGLSEVPSHSKFGLKDTEAVMGYAMCTGKYRFLEWYLFYRTSTSPDFTQVWGAELYDHTVEYQFINNENTSLVVEMR